MLKMNQALRLQNRIYFSTFMNTFGSWLTFLAIALIVSGRFGPGHVAVVFLVQTLPPILFSRSLAGLIPVRHQERFYWVSQILLAANSLLLVFSQELAVIYAHLFIGAFLKSVASPLFNTLLGKWVPADDQKETFTKVGALQAGTLALAPAMGAWIKITYSANSLFLIDALTFLVSIVVLKELFQAPRTCTEARETTPRLSWKALFAGISLRPKDIPKDVQTHLKFWFLFLTVGALLNALEFAGFANVKMSEKEIGFAMTAWGIGSLLPLLKVAPLGARILGGGYAVSLLLFVIGLHPTVAILSFFLAGALSAYLSGSLRSKLQSSVPAGYNALPVWAYANQITQVINLVCYASAGVLLKGIGFYPFGITMVVIATGLMLSPSQGRS